MKTFPIWKLLFFILIVLPVFLCLLLILIPVILLLLIFMPLLARRFVFRAKNFRGNWSASFPGGKGESGNSFRNGDYEAGEIVDVEGVVINSSNEDEEEEASQRKLLPPRE